MEDALKFQYNFRRDHDSYYYFCSICIHRLRLVNYWKITSRVDFRLSNGVVAAFIYLIWTLMLLHVLHHNEMCIFHYQIMASILLYHSYMKDTSRLCCASLCVTHTKNMNHIVRNVFVCTPWSFFLLLCCCLWYGSIPSNSARKIMW